MADILLEIVSPDRTVLSCGVDCVFLPGVVGEFEVLRNHAPLITSLSAGRIKFRIEGREDYREVLGGFAMVLDNKVSVCAEVPGENPKGK